MIRHVEQNVGARLAASMTWTFANCAPAEGYALARRLGFSGIEHSFPYATPEADIARLLRDNELALTFVYTPCRVDKTEKGFACHPGREDEFKRSVEQAIRYAEAGGAQFIGVLAGSIPTAAERAECLDVLLSNLDFAADAARALGIHVLVEPLSSRSAPDFVIRTLDQGAEVLRALNRAEARLCFDTAHVGLEAGSLVEQLDKHWDQIGYIQIANTPTRSGIGEGELDLLWFVRAVLDRGWRSWLSCEYAQKSGHEGMLEWAEPFRQAGKIEPHPFKPSAM